MKTPRTSWIPGIGAALLCLAASRATAVSVQPGQDLDALLFAGVQYQNLRPGEDLAGAEILAGTLAGSPGNYATCDLHLPSFGYAGTTSFGAWNSKNEIAIRYLMMPGDLEKISTTVQASRTASARYLIEHPRDAVNYLQLDLFERPAAGSPSDTGDQIALRNVVIDGVALGDFTASDGVFHWKLTDESLFADGFTLTATLELTGSLEAGDVDMLRLQIGHATPAAAQAVPVSDGGSPLLALAFSATILLPASRRFRRAIPES